MSGGSFNYLCITEMPDIMNRTEDMKDIEAELIKLGYTDIAKDIRRLIEYCLSAENRIDTMFEQLKDVFFAVEWYSSGDIDKDDLIEKLELYRKGGENNE